MAAPLGRRVVVNAPGQQAGKKPLGLGFFKDTELLGSTWRSQEHLVRSAGPINEASESNTLGAVRCMGHTRGARSCPWSLNINLPGFVCGSVCPLRCCWSPMAVKLRKRGHLLEEGKSQLATRHRSRAGMYECGKRAGVLWERRDF